MKTVRKSLAVLLAVLVACSLVFVGCNSGTTEIKDLEKSIEKATNEWLKNYVSTELKDQYTFNSEFSTVDKIENTSDRDYTVTGMLGVKEKDSGDIMTADYTMVVENVNHVGMVTATLRMLDFTVGEFRLAQAAGADEPEDAAEDEAGEEAGEDSENAGEASDEEPADRKSVV